MIKKTIKVFVIKHTISSQNGAKLDEKNYYKNKMTKIFKNIYKRYYQWLLKRRKDILSFEIIYGI